MEINKYDLNWCVRRLPWLLRETMKKYGSQIVVAGGYIRACILNEPVNDIDLFVADKDFAKAVALEMVDGKEKRLIITDNAITVKGLKHTIQFITRWVYDDPHKILESFDFTICQAAFWWHKNIYGGVWTSITSESFYQDLPSKRLIYTSPIREEEPGGSMLRVLKYYQRGYRITIDSLAAVITRLSAGVDYSTKGIVDVKTGDLDAPYFHKIISGLLHEVDPNIDPDHIIEDVKIDGDGDVDEDDANEAGA